MRKEVKDLIDQARYELKVAEDNLAIRNYATVAFNCQQAVEKLLKAIHIIKLNYEAPKTHSLRELLSSAKIKDKDITNYCLKLNPHYFQTRYPDVAEDAPYKLYNEEVAKELLAITKKIFKFFESDLK